MTEVAPLTYDSDEFTAGQNRKRLWAISAICLLISAIGAYDFFLNHEGAFSNNSSKSFLILIFMAGAAGFFLWLSRDKGVLLVINRKGIWEKTNGSEPWENIRFYYILKLKGRIENRTYLVLKYHNQQEKEIKIGRLDKSPEEIGKAIEPFALQNNIDFLGETTEEASWL